MKKKGFTLVELLAVIAILAILVIIALPNVIKLYNDAKKNAFLTEVKTLYNTASSKYISESLKGNKLSEFDITTAKGKYYIAKNRNLKTKTEISEMWKAEVTYVNLSESQDGNLDKKLDGFIRIEASEE